MLLHGVPRSLSYAELVNWTERQVRSDKCGHIAEAQPQILRRMGLAGDAFIDLACKLLERLGVAVGALPAMARACARRQRRFLHGQRAARTLARQIAVAASIWQIPAPRVEAILADAHIRPERIGQRVDPFGSW